MPVDLLERKPAPAPTDASLRFQWRGSNDGIAWSAWVDFTGEELATLRTSHGEAFRYCQARVLIGGKESDRTPVMTWPLP